MEIGFKVKNGGRKMFENKQMLLYSAQKTVNYISKVAAEDADDKECFFAIGTALHWVTDSIDRIPEKQIKDEHKKIFSGLRFANNCLKHNRTFIKAHEAKGHTYPYDYPYDYGTHFIWLSLDEVDVWDSKEKQRANYKNNFEGKNVFVTMSDIVNIIKEYYEIL